MADFRQLALEFVLADEDSKRKTLSQTAAAELINAAPDSNPVARWVESVQPWMPGNKDDVMEDGQDTPDWNARAKALEFLSDTLEHIDLNFLKSSQVKLLVAFFGAMFDVDHKAGISASASALCRIVTMKSFAPSSGGDIIAKICSLRDDFPRQLSKTRLQVYGLLKLLISDQKARIDLKRRDEGSLKIASDLIQLCFSERDPDCLMIWFAILQSLINDYEPPRKILDEIFGNFKSYFPITLPRTSQSGVTPEELKTALRRCFSSNPLLAPSVVPFLIGKLDQGDSLTVNVKLDILRTLKACFEEYDDPQTSVQPFTNQVWTSLKYEVRNGELEDTIWATLEVLKTIATRLQGDALRDYTFMVTRECVEDLSNPNYTSQAGRLIVSVLSANPSAFALMASPTLTHVKENLRHPKSPLHSEDLLKILHVVLESRILVAESDMSQEEKRDFGAVDSAFRSIYHEAYKTPIAKIKEANAYEDDVKVAIQAVQGAGALICQPAILPSDTPALDSEQKLLADADRFKICDDLFAVVLYGCTGDKKPVYFDELTNWATLALQRSVVAYPASFKSIVTQSTSIMDSSRSNPVNSLREIESLGPLIAFVGCSALPEEKSVGLDQFHMYALALATSLLTAIEDGIGSEILTAFAASFQILLRSFNDACQGIKTTKSAAFDRKSWQSYILKKYPSLDLAWSDKASHMDVDQIQNNAVVEEDIHADFLLSTLYLICTLYRRSLMFEEGKKEVNRQTAIAIRPEFRIKNDSLEHRFLHQLSSMASLIVHEMTDEQQSGMQVEKDALYLFMEDKSTKISAETIPLVQDSACVLQFGIIEALRPSSVKRLFDEGIAQRFFSIKPSSLSISSHRLSSPIRMASLAILANRYKLESLKSLVNDINQSAKSALQSVSSSDNSVSSSNSIDNLVGLLAILSGMVRRCPGKEAHELFDIVQSLPKAQVVGADLARQMDVLTAPQSFLEKRNFAVVKPLWMQRTYLALVKPMLKTAVGEDTAIQDPLIKMNYGVAVVLMLQHLNYTTFEEDIMKILRISIAAAQILETGTIVKAALSIMNTILHESSESLADHLRSVLQICIKTFAGRRPQDRPQWLPNDYVAPNKQNRPKLEAECSDLALRIVAAIPKTFENRYLVPLKPTAERELTLACGHRIRKLRQAARYARKTWAEAV